MGNQNGEFGLPHHSLSAIFGKVQCQRGPVVVSLCQALLLAAVHPSSHRPAHVTLVGGREHHVTSGAR